MYSIRQVDEDDWHEDLHRMQVATELWPADFLSSQWWIAFYGDAPAGYACMCPFHFDGDVLSDEWAYFGRVGVLPGHRGNNLQLRMMKAAERWAMRNGFTHLYSDTTNKPYSANNFIKAGWKMFEPLPDITPWTGKPNSCYWRKLLSGARPWVAPDAVPSRKGARKQVSRW